MEAPGSLKTSEYQVSSGCEVYIYVYMYIHLERDRNSLKSFLLHPEKKLKINCVIIKRLRKGD